MSLINIMKQNGYTIYICSCGLRCMGSVASYHALMLEHKLTKES